MSSMLGVLHFEGKLFQVRFLSTKSIERGLTRNQLSMQQQITWAWMLQAAFVSTVQMLLAS